MSPPADARAQSRSPSMPRHRRCLVRPPLNESSHQRLRLGRMSCISTLGIPGANHAPMCFSREPLTVLDFETRASHLEAKASTSCTRRVQQSWIAEGMSLSLPMWTHRCLSRGVARGRDTIWRKICDYTFRWRTKASVALIPRTLVREPNDQTEGGPHVAPTLTLTI